jgi:hypothetical protein
MKSPTLIVAALALALTTFTHADVPKGWWSPKMSDYQIGVDTSDAANPAAYIESIVSKPKDFTALNQHFSAEAYRGKRVRLKGLIKTKDVANWAGFWLRADAQGDSSVAFENMEKRGVSGTKDWVEGVIVLDIPNTAEVLVMGLILHGKGKAWMRDVSFEVVDTSVALTTAAKARVIPKAPVNLDFKQ